MNSKDTETASLCFRDEYLSILTYNRISVKVDDF